METEQIIEVQKLTLGDRNLPQQKCYLCESTFRLYKQAFCVYLPRSINQFIYGRDARVDVFVCPECAESRLEKIKDKTSDFVLKKVANAKEYDEKKIEWAKKHIKTLSELEANAKNLKIKLTENHQWADVVVLIEKPRDIFDLFC